MTAYLVYVAVAGAFAIGVGFGVLIMCLIAMGKLGDAPLPEGYLNGALYVANDGALVPVVPNSESRRQYQD
ncbi:hypothetical protein E5S69_11695 [Cupriavidus necator]|uniref:hypothetical protein n=1 Tax=Cupriavidus necator TaxID=106590 RepID=UPI0014903FA2|nr:hypothetical protein [Cupriavidus necator]NOV24175.1 hypothetical protein [Cupriavidus necator]